MRGYLVDFFYLRTLARQPIYTGLSEPFYSYMRWKPSKYHVMPGRQQFTLVQLILNFVYSFIHFIYIIFQEGGIFSSMASLPNDPLNI